MTEISKCSVCLTTFNSDKFKQTGRIRYGERCGHSDGENQEETEESALLNAQVSVIYLVHNILDIPLEKCSQYLKKYGNPADWVTLCQGCATTLENARYLYLQLLSLQKTLDDLKEVITSEMRVKDEDPNVMDFDEGDTSWITAAYEIRHYVAYAYRSDELVVEEKADLTTSKNPLTSDMSEADNKLETSLDNDDVSESESMFFIEEPDFNVKNSPSPKSVDEDFESEFFETINEGEEEADITSDKEECNDSNHDNKTRSQLRNTNNLVVDDISKNEEENLSNSDLSVSVSKPEERNINGMSFEKEKDSTTAVDSDEEVVIVHIGLSRTSGKPNSQNEKDDKVDEEYRIPANVRQTSGTSNRKTLCSTKSLASNTFRRLKLDKPQNSREPKLKGAEEETRATQATKLKKRVDRYSCHLCPQILDTLHQVRRHLRLKHSIPYDKVMDMMMKVDINGCYHFVTAAGGSKNEEEVKAPKSLSVCKKEFSCEICGLRYLYKNGLQKHFDEYHNTKVPLKSCSICRKHFHTDTTFNSHVKERPVKFRDSCSVSPTQLKKPFGCGHCQMSFASKKCIAFHVETHENSGNGLLKHFRCNICDARLKSFSYFVTHVTSHGKKVTIPKPPQLYINKTGPGPSLSWSGMNFNQAKNLIERIKASEAINPIPQYARSKAGSNVTFNKDKGVKETIRQKSVSVEKNDVGQTSKPVVTFSKAKFSGSVSIKRISQSARPVVNTYKNSNDSTCSSTPIAATASPGVAWPWVTCNKFMAVDQIYQKIIELGPVATTATLKPKVYTNFNLCPNCDVRIKSFTPDSEEFKKHLRFCQKKN